jgi:orotate phosphoribosyltransferase-like protein
MLVAAPGPTAAQIPRTEATDQNAADTIYSEIENLAGQGMSLEDISEDLNVPKGEVELVLKLKRLSAESAKNKTYPSA